MTKKTKNALTLSGLYVGSFLTAVAPVTTVVALNWSQYVSTPSRAVSLASGGVIALVLLVMQILGKTPKNVHRLLKFGFLTLACWAVYAIIDQVCLLVTCAFGGEALSWAIFTVPIRKAKEKRSGDNVIATIKEEGTLSGRV